MTKREDGGNFDLEERTALFGEQVIAFAKRSVGANYCEANDAESKKDFRHKIGICRKESKETKHWVRMIVAADPRLRDEGVPVWQEAKELNLIFGSILKGSK
jgi:four helix bundle protein